MRVFFTVSLVNDDLLAALMLPLLAMGGTGFLLSLYFWFRKQGQPTANLSSKDLDLKSPFELGAAVKFGVIFAALLFASKFAAESFGNVGLYLTAFFSGTFDVDAITVSMAHLSMEGSITPQTGSLGVLIAVMTNTLSKGSIVLFFAAPSVGRRVFLSTLLMVAVGAMTFFIPATYGAFGL